LNKPEVTKRNYVAIKVSSSIRINY